MVNAWSLLYDEIYGDYEMTDEKKKISDDPIEGGSASSQTTTDLGNGITISGLQDGVAVANISDDYDHSLPTYYI